MMQNDVLFAFPAMSEPVKNPLLIYVFRQLLVPFAFVQVSREADTKFGSMYKIFWGKKEGEDFRQ